MISLKNLRCPHCGAAIACSENGKSLVCNGEIKKHCFDISSSGYVNFAPPSQSGSGDSKDAIRSRTRFLGSGAYAPICQAIVECVNKHCGGGLVIDAGCGEGYYTTAIAEAYAGDVIGFDLSKFGVENGAKCTKKNLLSNAFFAVSSVFSMPVNDCCADAVVNIFAPCDEKEYSRVLKKGGVLITAGAGENHLLGLKRAVYDTTYKNTERGDMPEALSLLEEFTVAFNLVVDGSERILDLFSMTPYYYRTSARDVKKLLSLSRLETEIDVKIKIYRKD